MGKDMGKKEEFDTSSLAWLTYKVFYGNNFVINEKGRKHFELVFGKMKVNMSADTDFNFGTGWSNSIKHKYENYLNNVPENYETLYKNQLEKCEKLYKSILNVSLMPQTGNLQSTKKGLGNDRIDTYIWALNSFYEGETSLLFNNATFQNTECLKGYFDLFKENDGKPIYNYCSKIYGIGKGLVDDLILSGKMAIDSPERVIYYMNLAYRFWCHKLNHIQKAMTEKKDLLSKDEEKIMNGELEKVKTLLDEWYEN